MKVFAAPVWALIREVTDSFALALRSQPGSLDPERARFQLQHYARCLSEAGLVIQRLAGDENCPDGCFIEDDCVILADSTAVLTRPGEPSRQLEWPLVAQALEGLLTRLDRMQAPARLDGGDVLRVGDLLLVGLSGRSNAAGAEALAASAAPLGLRVLTVPVAKGLHLKSCMTLLAPDRMLILAGSPRPEDPALSQLSWIETEEPAGANVLALGRTVLVSAAASSTWTRLQAESDLVLRRVDVSEFHRADGALTCLSLRLPAPDTWCV